MKLLTKALPDLVISNFIWQFYKCYGGGIGLDLHSYIVLNRKMLCINEDNNTSKVLKDFRNMNVR